MYNLGKEDNLPTSTIYFLAFEESYYPIFD